MNQWSGFHSEPPCFDKRKKCICGSDKTPGRVWPTIVLPHWYCPRLQVQVILQVGCVGGVNRLSQAAECQDLQGRNLPYNCPVLSVVTIFISKAIILGSVVTATTRPVKPREIDFPDQLDSWASGECDCKQSATRRIHHNANQ